MARYDSMRKLERNADLLAYRKAHQDASDQEIATIYGITQQRVWAILNPDKVKAYRRNRREAAAK